MDAVDTINTLIKIVDGFRSVTAVSLPQYTKRTMVASRCYIQDTILDSSTLTDVLKVLQNLYVGYILTALQLNQYVSGNKTVRDLLGVISTEGLKGDNYIGAESIGNHFLKTFENNSSSAGKSGAIVSNNDKAAFPSGKILEVTFSSPDSKQSFKANIMVQLLPRAIPSEVMGQFIGLNFKPALRQRWLQYKTEEITFWKDFILQLDLLEKRRDAIKKDRDGSLQDMLRYKQNAITKHLTKFLRALHLTSLFEDDANELIKKIPDRHNISNSILIYEKSAFDRFCHDGNLNFKRFADRQKFFSASYSMIVVVIDTMYNDVDMYFNGIEASAKYTFDQMKDSANRDTMQLMTIMKQMSQGNAPRF